MLIIHVRSIYAVKIALTKEALYIIHILKVNLHFIQTSWIMHCWRDSVNLKKRL